MNNPVSVFGLIALAVLLKTVTFLFLHEGECAIDPEDADAEESHSQEEQHPVKMLDEPPVESHGPPRLNSV